MEMKNIIIKITDYITTRGYIISTVDKYILMIFVLKN